MAVTESSNGKLESQTVRYSKTENEYEVNVQAWFYSEGKSEFLEWDMWDVRPYPFVPCMMEFDFARSLCGQPEGVALPHLNLDARLADATVINWLTEPSEIAAGMKRLDLALRQFSLGRINGEHLLIQIANAVQRGRQLAEEKQAAKQAFSRRTAGLNDGINQWLRLVDRLVAAGRLTGYPPHDEPGKAA
jgi:hypothetical protein